jgi:hypothetical protein
MREKPPEMKIKIIGEHVDLASLNRKFLTNNVYAVGYVEEDSDKEWVDLTQGRPVDIFDAYYDVGCLVKAIWHAGGSRNPKSQVSELRVKIAE